MNTTCEKISDADKLALLLCRASNEFCVDCCTIGAGTCSDMKSIAEYLLENGVTLK